MGDFQDGPSSGVGVSADIHVLVTGFGLFRAHAQNSSYLIAKSLPATLNHAGTVVQVHCHPSPIEVSYKAVRSIVPSLIFADESSKPNFDIVVHMGMTNRPFYALETQARRDGFVKDDVTDSQLLDPEFWENQYGAPEVLKTGFDCEKTLYNWKKNLQAGGDVRLSHQAGLFLCEFTYYTGMLEYWRRGWKEAIPVVFLHVPIGFEDEDISRGRDITTALIKALVESKVDR